MMELILAFICGVCVAALPAMIIISRLQDDVRFAQMQTATIYKSYAKKEKTDVTC